MKWTWNRGLHRRPQQDYHPSSPSLVPIHFTSPLIFFAHHSLSNSIAYGAATAVVRFLLDPFSFDPFSFAPISVFYSHRRYRHRKMFFLERFAVKQFDSLLASTATQSWQLLFISFSSFSSFSCFRRFLRFFVFFFLHFLTVCNSPGTWLKTVQVGDRRFERNVERGHRKT